MANELKAVENVSVHQILMDLTPALGSPLHINAVTQYQFISLIKLRFGLNGSFSGDATKLKLIEINLFDIYDKSPHVSAIFC